MKSENHIYNSCDKLYMRKILLRNMKIVIGEDGGGHVHAAQDGEIARLLEQAGAALGEADLALLLVLYSVDLDPLAALARAATRHCLGTRRGR